MKNKKGFTLIELLAVIVILAIIALIATPIVLNMISSARKSAAKSAALGYIDSIEYYAGFHQISSDTDITGYGTKLPTMTDGKVTCTKTSSGWNSECSAFFTAVDTKAKGKKPETATIVISESGKVLTGTSMVYNGYTVNYDGSDVNIGGSSSSNNNNNNNNQSSGGPAVTTPGTLVYFDPVSTATCDSTHTTSETCYKWRIISVNGNNLTVQMDHDFITSAFSFHTNYNVPNIVLDNLVTATSEWTRVPGLDFTYNTTSSVTNYGILTCTNGICSMKKDSEDLIIGTSETPVRARLITVEEIKQLTLDAGASSDSLAGSWSIPSGSSFYFANSNYIIGTQTSTSGDGDTSLSWLVENNYYSGNNHNYWTLTPKSTEINGSTWLVRYNTMVDSVGSTNSVGVRPVITMPKSVFK